MALHIRSLKLKSCTLPHVLSRCFATQVQNTNAGDRRSAIDVELESFANELSSVCEEARKHVHLLPSLPSSSRLAVLLNESQKLVEAVNKHILISSLGQGAKPQADLSSANQSAPSWSKIRTQMAAPCQSVPHRPVETKQGNASKDAEVQERVSENLQGFGLFVQPYCYTSDDIIIRSDRLSGQAQSLGKHFDKHRQRTAGTASRGIVSDLEALNSRPELNLSPDGLLTWHPFLPPTTVPGDSLMKGTSERSLNALLYSALPSSSETPQTASKPPAPQKGLPSEEQLSQFQNHISRALTRFFVERHSYHVYHPEILLENNFWGTNLTVRGLNAYALQLNKLRILSHLKFAHVEVVVLKCTAHPEDGTVRVRWRLKGLSQFKALMFWKFLPWKYRKSVNDESQWYDGFSVYHLGSDGLVIKHRVDRIMPDEETEAVKSTNLAVKLGILMGLAPKTSLNDFASLFFRKGPRNSAAPGHQ